MTGHTDDSDRYLVISSDTHAGPPAERYRDYLDPEYRAAFDADLAMALEMNKARAAQSDAAAFEAKWEAETGDGGRRASWDPAVRDDELDKEGVAAEVIFPDADVLGGGASAPFHAGLGSSGDLDGELVMAGAQAHNRWLEELCASSPERRCGVATVPILHDIDAAVAEIERLAACRLPGDPDPHAVGRQAVLQRPALRAGLGGLRGQRHGRPRPFGRRLARHLHDGAGPHRHLRHRGVVVGGPPAVGAPLGGRLRAPSRPALRHHRGRGLVAARAS